MASILKFIKRFPATKAILLVLFAAVCLFIIKLVLVLFDKFVKKSKLDPMICKILRVSIKILLLFMALIIVLGSFGVSVSSLVAALSVVGVAFSLAIQGFLSNVFGGIQIISNKPFQIGDFVEAGGQSGSVREVGLFYTKLDTPDHKLIQIPNSIIVNANIINYSSAAYRRVDVLVSASYSSDPEKVKAALLEILHKHPLVIQKGEQAPVVRISAYKADNIEYMLRSWCKSGDYWTVYYDVLDAIWPTFDQKGIEMSFPHVNVHMM